MHNVMPHEFYGVDPNDMARKFMLAFSGYEVKKNNDSIKEMELKQRNKRR